MAVLSIGQVWAADVSFDFSSIGSTGWSNSYADHSVTCTDGTVYMNASKQTSNVTAVPVTKGQPVSFVLSDGTKSLSAVSFTCTQWTTKAQTITLKYSTNGGSSYSALSPSVTSTNFSISSSSLPEGTNAVQITFSSQDNQVGVASMSYTMASSTPDPALSVSQEIIDFGTVEQGTSVANKTVAVNFANLTGSVSYSGLTSPFTASGSISNTGDNITIAANTSTIGEYSRTLTVQSTADSKSATVTVKMNVVAPFNGEVLEIKNTDFATSYVSANGDHEFGCITITSYQVGNYNSSIQVQNNAGYLYNKTSLGEIAKIEITKTGNNKLVVYEGTSENPSETSITGVANDNVTTYTFSNGKSYFRISSDGTGASNVTPIKVYYHPASYEVTLSAGSNGTLSATVDDAAIASGDDVEMCKTVTITATPDEGYKIKSLTVTDEDDDEVEVTSNQFVMPAKAVTVAATFEATKALSSITLSGTQRTAFWVGETFSSTGLVVTAHYDDESSAPVTPNSITGYDMAAAGNQTVTVSYTEGTEKTATYDITVKALPTEANPATVAEIIDLYDRLGNTSNTYVKGTIYKLQTFYTTSNDAGKYTYWITDIYDSEAEPNHNNEFEIFKGLDFSGAVFTAADDIELGQEVVVKGDLTKWSSTYEFNGTGVIVSRPKVLKGIALSGTYPTEFTQGDEFSSEGLVVTASYNYGAPTAVTPTSITGYNMAATGNQTVTVSYTESGVTKTAEYSISVAAPSSCVILATISKGAEVNGTFSLSVSGEQCLDELPGNVISTVLTAEPAEHYHLASVEATVGTVGAIADNECTISDIDASTTITAVFAENDKVTVKFDKGTESATGDVPTDVANQYAGQSVTLPANPFTYTGSPIKVFGGWKHSLTNEVKQPGSYTITAADAAEDNITFTAVWDDLSPWATVYSSNVTLSSDQNVQVTIGTGEGANKAGVKANKGSSATFTIPAGTTHLYAHMAAWNGEGQSVTVSGDCFDENKAISIIADANVSGSGTTFDIDDAKAPLDYFKEIALDNEVTEPTVVTITAASNKRFVLFGVNAVYPAAITLDPASKDFGEVKENANAEFEFTITPNAMSTGDLVASIIGIDAAKFSASAISENKVTVTFTPGEVGGPYSASLKIVSDNAEVTAALSGTGITAATPEIGIDKDAVAFGNVEQNTTPATQSVAVTLSNIDEEGVSAAISGSVFSLSTNKLTVNGSIVITPVTTTPGTYSETLTLSATGATSKNVTVTMTVVDEWAYVYTSNVDIDSDTDAQVTIGETNYAAAKTSKGSSATITLPQGVTKIHMHLVAWKGEAQTVTVSGDCFDEDKEITIIANDGVSGSGTTYPLGASGVEYYCSLTPDNEVAANEVITITAASNKRFVLFGVNQEGGVLPVLESIEISGDLSTKTGYKVGDALDLDGLTVEATYSLGGVAQSPVDITSDPELELTYDPLVENQTEVTITASYKGQTDDITINGLDPVASADPKIYVSTLNVDFGSVEVGEAVPENETITVTLTNVAAATATLGGTNPEAFSIDKTALVDGDVITISVIASTAAAASYSATITITDDAAAATEKMVNLSFAVTEPVVYEEYQLVSDVASLAAGDQVIIVAEKAGDYYTLDGSISNQYFPSTAVSIAAGIITAPSTSAIILGKDGDNWTMSMGGQLIGATAAKKASLGNNGASNTWTIAIAENVATITNTATAYGSLQFNYNNGTNPRFLNYASEQTAVAIYKKVAPDYGTYHRDVTSGNYGTICLPKNGTITGATLYDIADYAGGMIYVDEVIGHTMAAGKPYIFYATSASLDVTYTDDNEVAVGHANGLYGSYTQELLTPNDGNYILHNNQYWLVNGTAYVGANRAYIKIGMINYVAPMPGRRRIGMTVHGEQVVTGIDELNASETPVKMIIDGQLYILRGEKMYNANGQIVK